MIPRHLFAQQSTGTTGATTGGGPAPTGTADPGDRSTSFRPVEGGGEMQSGEKLLVEAYAAFWLIAFLFILGSWRRQRALDRRIADLESAVARARKDGEAGES